VIDLDERLQRGPLKVRSLGVTQSADALSRRILKQRRVRFARNLVLSCAAIAVAAFVAPRLLTAPEVVARKPVAPALSPRAQTTFADGSFAQLSGPGDSLAVEEESEQRVVTRLRGKARFDVVQKQERAFEVHSGEVRVRVLGSAFSMEELPGGKARVLVERGPVQVAWLGGSATLQSGQGGAFPPEDGAQASTVSGELQALPAAQTVRPTREKRSARSAATRAQARDDASELMREADALRLHGQAEQAVKPLRTLFERYPDDARAPLAAFALGRVLLDDLHRPADAAAAFARVRTLSPDGALAPDALAREASAWQAAGQSARAHKLAEQYLALYPRGRHAKALQKTLAR
jgi:TolA-binding protein